MEDPRGSGTGGGRAEDRPGPAAPGSGFGPEVVEASPDGVVVVDADGSVVYVNAALERLSGWDRSRVVGQPLETLVPEDLREGHERSRATYGRAPRERTMGEGRGLVLARPDGTGVAVDVALAPVHVAGRAMTVATVRDASPRCAEDERRDWLASLLDVVPDGVVVVDRVGGVVVGANEAASDLLGRGPGDLLGMPSAALLARAGDGEEPATESLLTDGGHLHRVGLLHADGTVVECEVHATTAEGPGGAELVVNVVRDISDRVALEQRVRESEEMFRTAFDQAPVGIAVTSIDDAGRRAVERTNVAFTAMFGYEPGDLDGKDPAVLRPTHDVERPGPPRELAVAGEVVDRTVTRRYTRRDGSGVWAEVRASRLELPHVPSRALFLVRAVDVTVRFEQEVVARREWLASQCVAGVARAALEHRAEAVVLERIAAGVLQALEADGGLVLLAVAGPGAPGRWGAVDGPAGEALAAAVDRAGAHGLVAGLVGRAPGAWASPPPGLAEGLSDGVGPLAGAPFGRPGSPTEGAVLACRAPGREPFGPDDVERLGRLAVETQVAVHLARARADQQRLALLEERQRIARELHDSVIQDAIALGMQISADIDAEPDPERQERDLEWVAQLELVTRNLRRAVFELRSGARRGSTATAVTDAVAEASRVLGHRTSVTFTGPVESLPDPVADDLVAVLREALANVARHARASASAVSIEVSAADVTLTVDDNGLGRRDAHRGQGIDNMAARAHRHGGHLSVAPGPVTGTRVVWSCPLGPDPGGH